MHACMFFDPDEGVIVSLLFNASHVFVEIVIDVFVAITCVEGLQEKFVVVLGLKL